MGRGPCWESEGLRKGAWTAEEDQKLIDFIKQNNGHGSWRTLPKLAGLQRCGKSCRLRWTNYLRPNIKRGNFTSEEETSIIQFHALVGNRWAYIASHLPGRTDNEVKNHWNTHLKKRLAKMGIDPETHRPIVLNPDYNYNLFDNPLISNTNYTLIPQSNPLLNTNHSTQLPLTIDQVARLLQAQNGNNVTNHHLMELLNQAQNPNCSNSDNPDSSPLNQQLQYSILLQNYAAQLQNQLLNLLSLSNPYKNEELQLMIKALISNLTLINALNTEQRAVINSSNSLPDRLCNGISDQINPNSDITEHPCNPISQIGENLINNSASVINVHNSTDQITNLNTEQYNYVNYSTNQELKSDTATSNSSYGNQITAEKLNFGQSSNAAPAKLYEHGSSVNTVSCCTTPDSGGSASTENDISDPFIVDLLSSDYFYANNGVDNQIESAEATVNYNWGMINNNQPIISTNPPMVNTNQYMISANQCSSEVILSSNLLQEQSWADQCMLINGAYI